MLSFVRQPNCWCALALALASLFTPLAAHAQTDGGFVYALWQPDIGPGNLVYGYSVNPATGVLTPVPGSPFATGGAAAFHSAPENMVYDDVNGRLYVFNNGSNTISVLAVNRTTGALTPLPFSPMALPPLVGSFWSCLDISPNGTILAVGEAMGNVATFVVTDEGATPAPGSPVATDLVTFGVGSLEFSRNGAYLYAGGGGCCSPGTRVIAGFAVNQATGALTHLAGSPFASGGILPVAYATDSAGRLFSADGQVTGTVQAFTSTGGILSPVSGSPFPSGHTFASRGLMHPAGGYIVSDHGANRIGVFAVTGAGSGTTLAAVPGSPFASGGTPTQTLALSDSGSLLFAGHGFTRNISTFRVNANLTLTPLSVQAANTVGSTGVLGGLAYVPIPTMTLTPPTVNVAATKSGGALQFPTPAQTLRLMQDGGTPAAWTATVSQPWITVSPRAGTGPATLTVTVSDPDGSLPASGRLTGTITITTVGATPPTPATMTLTMLTPAQVTAPFGWFDTPGDDTTGVTGPIPITGWALDDIGVSRVRIMIAGETPGVQLFIANAVFVAGARPDVAGAFPTWPFFERAGWGLLMLTNVLPNQGNGTFTIYAYADDVEGHTTLLGSKTLTCTNATATLPFGTIDTPTQGGLASGTAFANVGWALTPQPKAIPIDGSTIGVFIDSAPIGALTSYNHPRPDIQALFPGYANTNGAVGVRTIDTTTLSNGLHTIAWVATDNAGAPQGIGSRFFTVANGAGGVGSVTTAMRFAESASPGTSPESVTVDATRAPVANAAIAAGHATSWREISVRRGHRDDAETVVVQAEADGVREVRVASMERIVFDLDPGDSTGATYRGYSIHSGELRALPVGSTLNAVTGEFAWAPPLAFGGRHALVFVREADRGAEQIRVDVTIDATPARGEPQLVIDVPGQTATVGQRFTVAGWAIDPNGPLRGTGVDTLHVWAHPVDGGAPIWIGVAGYGGWRPDVATLYGWRFLESGFSVDAAGLSPGTSSIAVYAHSITDNRFSIANTVRITVRRR